MADQLFLRIDTLTPVHIGSGQEIQGNFEYLFFDRDRRIALIDEARVLGIIGPENLNQWLSIIDQQGSLLDYLTQRKPDLKPADVARRIMTVPAGGPPSDNAILEQLHDGQGRPSLPGSSLKGAFRTAVMTKLLRERPELAQAASLIGFENRKSGRFIYKDNGLENELAAPGVQRGKVPNSDIFRLLRLGDVYFSSTEVFRTQTLNKKHNGWKLDEQISPFVESIPKGQAALARMTRPESTLLQYLDRQPRTSPFRQDPELTTWQALCQTINAHTRQLLQRELDFWAEEGNPAVAGEYVAKATELIEQLDDLRDARDTCILRVGYGSGVSAMTGSWQGDLMTPDDYQDWANSFRKAAPHLAFPKTRKLTAQGEPFGFVKLTPVSADQVPTLEAELQQQQAQQQAELQKVFVPEKVKPQYVAERIRVGTVLDAFVFASGKGKKVKKVRVYVGKGKDIDLSLTYPADAIVGKIILVTVTDMQDGQVGSVKFKGIKQENR